MSLEEKALVFAREKHNGAKRKFNGEEYINHPMRVCNIVREFTENEQLLCVALLHDTLEDTNTTGEELEKSFGLQIASMVLYLTNNKEILKKTGKADYLCMKMNSIHPDVLLIKLADRLDNVSDLSQENVDKEWAIYYAEQTRYILERLDLSKLTLNHLTIIERIKLAINPFITHQ